MTLLIWGSIVFLACVLHGIFHKVDFVPNNTEAYKIRGKYSDNDITLEEALIGGLQPVDIKEAKL